MEKVKTYQQFLSEIDCYYKKIGLKEWPPAPIVHNGFPGNFNLSLTEYDFISKNKDYFSLKKDMVYAKTQSCIRVNDLSHIIKDTEHSYRYLALFSIATPGGVYWKRGLAEKEKLIEQVIKNLIGFLVDECALDINKLYVQYCQGGSVNQLTDGKYQFGKVIPADPNLPVFEKMGVPKQNFIPVANRDGLLALNIYSRPTPWGYRNEIYYKYQGKLLDIATFENLVYKPIRDKKDNIIGLADYENTLVLGGIGVERVLMVLNDLKHINELEIIQEPSTILRSYLDPQSAQQLVQLLRAVQLIVADTGGHDHLDKRRREKYRLFMEGIRRLADKHKLPNEILLLVLKKIAQVETNLPQLRKAAGGVISDYEMYKLRSDHPHSWQEMIAKTPSYQ